MFRHEKQIAPSALAYASTIRVFEPRQNDRTGSSQNLAAGQAGTRSNTQIDDVVLACPASSRGSGSVARDRRLPRTVHLLTNRPALLQIEHPQSDCNRDLDEVLESFP